MSAGGKRKGAGRKPRSIPLEAVTIRIEPEHAERFRTICKAKGKSQAEQFTEFIKRGRIKAQNTHAQPPKVG